ncbi:MAG: hypothetical protein SFX74_05345 [Fimbriimonadaceae bacterium]|nr:hypothetical protein [Fimbriimonadaceae bacterium]
MLAIPIALVVLPSPPAHVEAMIRDMTLPHEAIPRGVPAGVDWRERPRLAMGDHPGEFRAFITWGQVYAAEGVTDTRGVRVQIRYAQAWLRSKRTGAWRQVQFAQRVEGAAYVESFANDANQPADLRTESDGSISVTIVPAHNFHFWTPSRIAIDPADIGGVVTAVQARLVLDPEFRQARRPVPALMMSMGADYWKALDSPWDHFKTNGDAGIGRFRKLTGRWSWHYMTTVPADTLRKVPPPPPTDRSVVAVSL